MKNKKLNEEVSTFASRAMLPVWAPYTDLK